jgi:hypothetical protein
MTVEFVVSRVFALLLVVTAFAETAGELSAQQFRIETEVFAAAEQVVARSLTIFDGKVAYDFLMTSEEGTAVPPRFAVEEVVVFDQVAQKIILLDQKNRHRLEIGHSELLSLVAGMRASDVLRSRDEFLLEPKLTESFDPERGVLELSSTRLTYLVAGQSLADTQTLAHYYSFADWAARLNVTDSRKLPPFARLQLNQAMKRRGWIPTEVQFQLTSLEGQVISATAKHHTLFQLSDNDQHRIDSVQKQLTEFPSVSLSRYRNLTTAAN